MPAAADLYARAQRSFAIRRAGFAGSADPDAAPRRLGAQLAPGTRSWMAAHEELGFSRHLQKMGEAQAAARIARRALHHRPFDPVVWWHVSKATAHAARHARRATR